jgi:Tol biopolymer transport system component
MTARLSPLTDLDLTEALSPSAQLAPPAGLIARIEAEIDVTGQRGRSRLRMPAIMTPHYPDQRNVWVLAVLGLLLVLSLFAAAVVASRLLERVLPHANGPVDIAFRNGYIEVAPDGSSLVEHDLPGLDYAAASWSPRGDRIAFWGGRDHVAKLVFADAHGTVLDAIDVQARLGLPSTVAPAPGVLSWSADGQILVFDGSMRGSSRIFRYDVPTATLRDITPPNVIGAWPAVSPDGHLVALIPDDEVVAGRRPWIMTVDGTNAHPLGDVLPDGIIAGSGFGAPTWSNDGRQLLFEAQISAQRMLFVVDGDGANLRRIAAQFESPFNGFWSPDGGQILFENAVASLDHDFDAWIVDRDGSNPIRVIEDADPLGFSPDGSAILVSTPSCSGYRRRANLCEPAIWSIDRKTGIATPLVSRDQLNAVGPLDIHDVHDGLGWSAWRPVYR